MTQQFHSQVYSRQKESLYPHKDVHKNVWSSFIHNSQKLQTTQIFILKRLDKETAILKFRNTTQQKKNKILTRPTPAIGLKHAASNEITSDVTKYMLFDSI